MSLEIFLILFFVLIILSRLAFSKNYRIYYTITAFFSLRLWMAILASIYYASGNVYMQEIESYTTNSSDITLTLFLIGVTFLFLESLASKYLAYQYNKLSIQVTKNIYSTFLLFFMGLFLLINIYLGIETVLAFDPISANKMVFINFTHFPYLYKILDPLSLLTLVVIAYGLSINKLSVHKIPPSKTYVIYFVFIFGLSLFAFRFIHIYAKSPYMVMMLLYFIGPMYIFNHKFHMTFFKNKIFMLLVSSLIFILMLFTFYSHYGDTFLIKIGERILLEGQLLYSSLEYYFLNDPSNSFLDHFPGNDDETRGMVYMMEQFLPQHKLNQFYTTGWQMSGTLPGYNFMFDDMWIASLYWLLNFIFFILLISRGINTFLNGQIMRTFLYFNTSFLVGFFYLILGSNYLFSYRFWVLLFLIIFIEIIYSIKNKKTNTHIEA